MITVVDTSVLLDVLANTNAAVGIEPTAAFAATSRELGDNGDHAPPPASQNTTIA